MLSLEGGLQDDAKLAYSLKLYAGNSYKNSMFNLKVLLTYGTNAVTFVFTR